MTKLEIFISKVILFAGSARGKFNSITTIIGSLSSLTTTIKTSIVNSINEVNANFANYIQTSQKGSANGVAETDGNNKVLAIHLPSYMDDVLDGEYISSTTFNDPEGNPYTLESGKIYVDTVTNKTYRYTGTILAVISDTIALGETSSTAYRGDRGKTAYDHSLVSSGNPHGVTKANVGLGSVENYPISTLAQNQTATTKVAYTTPGGVTEQLDYSVGDSDPNSEFLTGLN